MSTSAAPLEWLLPAPGDNGYDRKVLAGLLLELQIARGHAVSLRAQLGLQALRDFEEQTRQRFPIDGVIARRRRQQPLE